MGVRAPGRGRHGSTGWDPRLPPPHCSSIPKQAISSTWSRVALENGGFHLSQREGVWCGGKSIDHNLGRVGPRSWSCGCVGEELSIGCNLVAPAHCKEGWDMWWSHGTPCVQLKIICSLNSWEQARTYWVGITGNLDPKHLTQRSSTKHNCYCFCLFFETLRRCTWKMFINVGHWYHPALDFGINIVKF